MTLEQLRIFVAVAEREHVTQAARALNMTQSATSAAITALENRYATRLFDRIGRRIALTEAGRLFLAEARAVLARAAAAERVLADLADLKRGSLLLAASQTVASYWLPQVVERYRSRYPGIAIAQSIGNTEYVAGRVRDGLADLGFAEGDIDDPALAVTPVAEDELVLVVPRRHPWARRPPRSPEEIAAGPWVLREPGSGTRAIFEAALPGLGLAPPGLTVALEVPSNEAVRAAVEAGTGVTAISRLVVANAIKAGTLAAVKLELPRRHFFLVRHRERYTTKAAQAFVQLVAGGR
ncbi:MAG TPA: LysR family transcriptional regulator [Hyphomicrobiaceae bacterium]|jgi:DNA-binding transcriptional LysR family regulator